MTSGPNIAIINAYSPPHRGSRAERWHALSQALLSAGANPTVIAPSFETLGITPDPGWSDPEYLVRLSAPSALGKIGDRVLWPDRFVHFGLAAGAWLCANRNRFDAVITSCLPASDLLSGYEAFRSADLPWLVDLGDPWALSPSLAGPERRPLLNIERRLLRSCAGLLVTTESTRALYIDRLSTPHHLTHVVPAAVPRLDYPPAPTDRLRLLQAGTVYGPRASVLPFAAALQDYNDAQDHPNSELIWYGAINGRPREEAAIRSVATTFENSVSLEQVIASEHRSNVLVVFGNHGGVQVPGKIWRSLGTGRTMLIVLADDQDAMASIPELNGRTIRVRNERSAILAALQDLHPDEPTQAPSSLPPLPSWDDRAQDVLRAVEHAISKAPNRKKGRLSSRTLARSITMFGGAAMDNLPRARQRLRSLLSS